MPGKPHQNGSVAACSHCDFSNWIKLYSSLDTSLPVLRGGLTIIVVLIFLQQVVDDLADCSIVSLLGSRGLQCALQASDLAAVETALDLGRGI